MRYEKHTVDRGGRTDWIQPIRRGYKMACCDCGLVHKIDFRVKNGRVQLRAARDNRATAAKRRYRK